MLLGLHRKQLGGKTTNQTSGKNETEKVDLAGDASEDGAGEEGGAPAARIAV